METVDLNTEIQFIVEKNAKNDRREGGKLWYEHEIFELDDQDLLEKCFV